MVLGSPISKSRDVTSSPHGQTQRVSSEFQGPAPEEKIAPAQIIDEITQKVLSGMPLRFINLDTGTFSSSAELFRIFKRSPEYLTLMAAKSLTLGDLAEQAENVIRKYFAYVMLSHVWDEDEPLYADVKSIANVLDMSSSSPGTLKLQNFCRIAKQRGFRWCWSDTCCIDKSSSAELQESINSMFTWYRNSALTIAFLMDVFQSTPDALKRSRWFTRGWTLQELLAPTAIVFYVGDWTPFLVSSAGDATSPTNHKLIPGFTQCLEDILGIDKSYLVDFNPGLEDVRERLRWVAARRTTKIEDMAYCLLGILDLRLPVLYGEGERAFIRLQEEIMKNTDDTCIFDWVGEPSALNSFLARSPSCFCQPAWHPPHQFTKPPMLEAVSDLTYKLSATFLRVAESFLDEPPLGHFIANGRMNLRAFVYQVKSIELADSAEAQRRPVYTYHVKAQGLEPLTVITTYKTPDVSLEARSLSIGRVWDNTLRLIPGSFTKTETAKRTDESVDPETDDNLDCDSRSLNSNYLTALGKRLREPFVAQLLRAHPDGVFRRVHTEERIIARPHLAELPDFRTPRTLIVH